MALVRILVDGSCLLNAWANVAPGKPRHSAAAKEEFINRLTQYDDACGTPITVVFDGRGTGTEDLPPSTPEVELIVTHAGQPARQSLFRMLQRFKSYGDVLVVGDPEAAKSSPATPLAVTSEQFITTVEEALEDLERNITDYNQKERSLFNRAP